MLCLFYLDTKSLLPQSQVYVDKYVSCSIAAKRGYAPALYFLGVRYLQGKGVPQGEIGRRGGGAGGRGGTLIFSLVGVAD